MTDRDPEKPSLPRVRIIAPDPDEAAPANDKLAAGRRSPMPQADKLTNGDTEKRSQPRVRIADPDPEEAAPSREEVGYGRPPRETRFKPGKSGNPRGRPKGVKNQATLIREFMQQKITVKSKSGRLRKVTIQQGLIQLLGEKALKGDLKTIQYLMSQQMIAEGILPESQELNLTDQDILARCLAELTTQSQEKGERK